MLEPLAIIEQVQQINIPAEKKKKAIINTKTCFKGFRTARKTRSPGADSGE